MESNQWNGYKALSLKWKLMISMGVLLAVSLLIVTIFSALNPDSVIVLVVVGIIVFSTNLFFMHIFLLNILSPITKLNEMSEKMSRGEKNVSIEVSSGDEIGQLAFNILKIKNNINLFVDEISNVTGNIQLGKLFSRVEEDKLPGKYNDILKGVNSIINNLILYLDELNLSIIIVDKDFRIQFLNKYTLNILGNPPKPPVGMRCHEIFSTKNCNSDKCPIYSALKTGKPVITDNVAQMGDMVFYMQNTGIPIHDANGEIVGALEFTYDTNDMVNSRKKTEKMLTYQEQEVECLIKKLESLANGHLDVPADIAPSDKDTQAMYENFKKLNASLKFSITTIKSYIDELNNVLNEMSNHNMNLYVTRDYIGDFVTIKDSINNIVDNMNNVLVDIQSASSKVHNDASTVANTNRNLVVALNEQENSVSAISEIVTNVSIQTKKNAEYSFKANELSNAAKAVAEDGNKQMNEMVSAMEDIKNSSDGIAKIIKVIDDIAFQTNLLALNAAVEAARAGQHGKGFAVVAEEVRNLAARSAAAAKETTAMIDDSLRKVDIGSDLAHKTSDLLSRIVSSVSNVTQIVSEISEASSIQTQEILQIEGRVKNIFDTTQSNLSILQQNSYINEEMAVEALRLQEIVDQFQLHKAR